MGKERGELPQAHTGQSQINQGRITPRSPHGALSPWYSAVSS